jgi:CRISPR system Cascade subunit CasA
MIEKEFNLLDERWIRVLDEHGKLAELSLLENFARAHLCKRLANATETLDAALLRLLLAIMYAVFSSVDADGADGELTAGNAVPRWQALWEKARFPDGVIEGYLEYYRERFYLFHPDKPFYQVANLSSRNCTEYRGPKLIGDISQSGNKSRLFFARTDSDRIGNSEAARWLLHMNAFDDTSAKPSVRGAGMESPGAGWLGKLGIVFSEGENLFQTLLLNFVLLNSDGEVFERGRPIWEEDIRIIERERIPQIPRNGSLAQLYTIQSRRLLLTRENGAVVGYRLLGGDFFDKENAFIEQMTLWQRDAKTETFTPMRHDPAKQLWRDFSALITSKDGSIPPGIVQWHARLISKGLLGDMKVKYSAPSVGYGDKNSSVDDLFSDSLSVNSYLLGELGEKWRTRIVEALKETDYAVRCFGGFAWNLAFAKGVGAKGAGAKGAGKIILSKIRDTACEEAYGELDVPFRDWLAGLTGAEDPDEAIITWKRHVQRILGSLAEERLNSAGDAARIGRRANNDDSKKKKSDDSQKTIINAFTAEIFFMANLRDFLSGTMKGRKR